VAQAALQIARWGQVDADRTPRACQLDQQCGGPARRHGLCTSVAAFGQKLRGDKYLGSYGWADIRALAGEQRGYLREEYLKLVGLAAAQSREAQ
jgi:Ca-activated chloride channel family protein